MLDLSGMRLTRSNLATPISSSGCTGTAAHVLQARIHRAQRRVDRCYCNASQLGELRDWICFEGGSVHPALLLSDNAPSSGCRGIVAGQDISLQDLEAGPLISVPQALQFTSTQALNIIEQHAGSALAAAAAEQLSSSQLTAVALAHELQHEANSSWGPYLQTLPSKPPCPWLLTSPQQIAECIAPYSAARGPAAVAGWAEATAQQRQQMLDASNEAVQLLGPSLGITAELVLQALAHVASRSLTSGSSSGLVPFIDLVNHGAEAMGPMLQLDDNDRLVMTVLPIRNGEAVPLAEGQELLICYQGGYEPPEAFLKFGFVADEWWQQEQQAQQ
uniref:SET domain-containing protein n=1 Tax=Tetradesmus obliquus TaxID=3088 RepID=A0A383WCJ6_TETOB|eukprot:jgi/Sobl393_1/16724/SZX74426.1